MTAKLNLLAICLLTGTTLTSCAQNNQKVMMPKDNPSAKDMASLETTTLGAGCFWCVEAIFQNLEGVESVVSGYSGGTVDNPSYRDVTSGKTGHAEVCQIKYDPKVISFDEILEVFWQTHDPTTLNRQGNDVGSQYRSAVFYHNDHQKTLAEKYKMELNNSGSWENSVVTEIVPFKTFTEAEDYHQDYFSLNPNLPYCTYVIQPKLEKFKKVFADRLKKVE